MIHKTYTIRFILHRRKDTPRQHLQMRVTPRGGKPVSFAMGKALTAAEWDANIGMAKGRTPEAALANAGHAQGREAGVVCHGVVADRGGVGPVVGTCQGADGGGGRGEHADGAVVAGGGEHF